MLNVGKLALFEVHFKLIADRIVARVVAYKVINNLNMGQDIDQVN